MLGDGWEFDRSLDVPDWEQLSPLFGYYVNQGRIEKPMKYVERVSVWNAEYIRRLVKDGIPAVTVAQQ